MQGLAQNLRLICFCFHFCQQPHHQGCRASAEAMESTQEGQCMPIYDLTVICTASNSSCLFGKPPDWFLIFFAMPCYGIPRVCHRGGICIEDQSGRVGLLLQKPPGHHRPLLLCTITVRSPAHQLTITIARNHTVTNHMKLTGNRILIGKK